MKLIFSLIIILLFFACALPGIPDLVGADGKALFENKCSTCHKLTKSTSKKKDKEEWTKTVMRMKKYIDKKQKDKLSTAEANSIIDFLSANYGK